jgi:hypothetical protein
MISRSVRNPVGLYEQGRYLLMGDDLYISRVEVKRLFDWHSENGVLSVYVNTDERDVVAVQKFKGLVRSELHGITRQHPGDKHLKNAVDEAFDDILNLPQDIRRRSLVYFRNTDNGDVFMKSLQIPVKTQSTWMTMPFLRPLVSILDEFPDIGIVVMTREGSRLMTWRQGLIDESHEKKVELDVGVEPEEVVLTEDTEKFTLGVSDDNRQKEMADIHRQLHEISGEVEEYGKIHKWQNIMLIGANRLVEIMEDSMKPEWRDRIIGKLNKNFSYFTHNQIAGSITDLMYDWKNRMEEGLVENILDTANSRGRAVLGVQKTIDALEQQRVAHLIFNSDLRVEGYRDNLGNLFVDVQELPLDGLKKEPFIVERMMNLAYDSSARVTPVNNRAAELLNPFGGAAAMLRY